MAGCTIGVIASTGSEAVSRVALEWMAARRPLIATKVGCLPEIVADKSAGLLVEPKDAPALARALGYLLHNPKVAQSMAQAARKRVEEHFTLPQFVDARRWTVYEQGALKEARTCLSWALFLITLATKRLTSRIA